MNSVNANLIMAAILVIAVQSLVIATAIVGMSTAASQCVSIMADIRSELKTMNAHAEAGQEPQ